MADGALHMLAGPQLTRRLIELYNKYGEIFDRTRGRGRSCDLYTHSTNWQHQIYLNHIAALATSNLPLFNSIKITKWFCFQPPLILANISLHTLVLLLIINRSIMNYTVGDTVITIVLDRIDTHRYKLYLQYLTEKQIKNPC